MWKKGSEKLTICHPWISLVSLPDPFSNFYPSLWRSPRLHLLRRLSTALLAVSGSSSSPRWKGKWAQRQNNRGDGIVTFTLKPQIYIKSDVTETEQETFFQPRRASHTVRSCSWERTFYFRDTGKVLRWGQPCLVKERAFLSSICSPRRDHQLSPRTPSSVIGSLPYNQCNLFEFYLSIYLFHLFIPRLSPTNFKSPSQCPDTVLMIRYAIW